MADDVGEFTYRRRHRAPRELLFECMTTPSHLAQFWGPAGTTTPTDGITVDLRPGGVFETVMVNDTDGSKYTMRAIYQEVDSPTRLVWLEPESGMTTTITFTDLRDGTTEVVTHQTNVPAPYRSPAARAGFASSLDRYQTYIGALCRVASTGRIDMRLHTATDLRAAVATEFISLADLLETVPPSDWNTSSLCDGWRVREVVAHITMPVRYSPPEFQAELLANGGDFTRLSNTIATRDAALSLDALIDNLRDEALHHWTPPGGGEIGALNHVVVHGLDITVPLGADRLSSDATLVAVLDDLTRGGTHAHFGFDIDRLGLHATDLAWEFGSGRRLAGAAADLVLVMCGRRLPPGRFESA